MAVVKLGRSAIKHLPARRLLGHHLLEMLPPPPPAVDNTNGGTSWGMMKNDVLGDCTCAGLAHSLQIATLNSGIKQTPSDEEVLQAYEQFCGYNPADSSTDQGGVEVDILTAVSKVGFAGHKLLGWASPDPGNIDHWKKAIAYFNAVYIGAAMPLSAQNNGPTVLWNVESGNDGVAGGWGGHCLISAKYAPDMTEFITWGANQPATWDWRNAYVDEVHVLLWDCDLAKFPVSTQETILSMLDSLD